MEKQEENVQPGQPRKNPTEVVSTGVKSIYFPNSIDYNLIWKEFNLIAQTLDNPTLHNRNKFWRRGLIIRRMIVKFVLSKTQSNDIKEVAQKIIDEEDAERIKKWETDTGKKHDRTI